MFNQGNQDDRGKPDMQLIMDAFGHAPEGELPSGTASTGKAT